MIKRIVNNQQNDQLLDAYETMLTSIYDEIFITDSDGLINSRIGDMKNLWGEAHADVKTANLFDLATDTFVKDRSLEQFLDRKASKHVLTTWNDTKVIVSVHKMNKNSERDFYLWGFRRINNDKESVAGNVLDEEGVSSSVIAQSEEMKKVITQTKMVSKTSSTVLLLGESGVGKEVIARLIHDLGCRKSEPFVPVNCGAIPENLLESELFGYEEGAFSGAKKDGYAGKFEQAHHGVLFLDEIGEISMNLQVKLLRAIQEREITPLGSTTSKAIDIQIIAATNKSLEQLVAEGKFREDLYYRLNVVPIKIPPLRDRVEDIPYLIDQRVDKFNQLYDRSVEILSDAMDLMCLYKWPGNVRELENVVERIIVTAPTNEVDASFIHDILPLKKEPPKTVPIFKHIMPLQTAIDLVEEQLITMAMKQYKSAKLAAQALEVSQPTMSRKYKAIREKLFDKTSSPTEKYNVLSEQLDKQLISMSVVTAPIIQAREIIELKREPRPSNPSFKTLQNKLTKIRENQGNIAWVFIFDYVNETTARNLVGDDNFVIEPGELYEIPPEMVEVAKNAWEGKAGVTPIYEDVYGEWKTSFAPIRNELGEVISIIGYDFSKKYIYKELKRIENFLNFNI